MSDESSAAILTRQSDAAERLRSEKAALITREVAMEHWKSNLRLAEEALKEARGYLADGKKDAASRVKALEAKRDLAEMTLQDMRRRHLEVQHSVAMIENEVMALQKKWETARERERAERSRQRSRGRSR